MRETAPATLTNRATSGWSAFSANTAFFLTWASAATVLVSIAASQILLGLATAALLLSGTRLRLPKVAWLLALFVAGTLISLAFSPDPGAGRPQIRKFFIYLILLLVYSTFRRLVEVRRLVLSWAILGAVSSVLALTQFARSFQAAAEQGHNFYLFYIAQRITGFMSHWMTFSGEGMIALMMAAALLLFSPATGGGGSSRLQRWTAVAACAVLALALVFGFTRAVWLGSAAGLMYLGWHACRKLLLAVPVAMAAMLVFAPVRERMVSLVRPGDGDSNQHRIVCWRTGLAMIKARPLVGVGPEMVGPRFREFVPADIPRPLPEGWYGHLHNIYLQYTAERGLPTAACLVAILIVILRDFTRRARQLPPGRSDAKFVLHGAAAAVIAIMIAGLFEHNLGDTEVLTMFLTVVAGGYVAVEQSADGAARDSE